MTWEQVHLALEDLNPTEILEMLSLEKTDQLLLALSEYIRESHVLIETNLQVNGVI